MSVSSIATEVEHGLQESQNARDVRVEELWAKLDLGRKGELDFKGLQRGFRKLDHPMKDAEDMLKLILKEVDTNGDGKIQYEEFRNFVERAEMQLFVLFKAIDKDGNGKLDLRELQAAFRSAGLKVSNRRLSEFFSDMDENNDGFVSFEEWRDFLLFVPAHNYDSRLRAVLTYYNSVVSVTPEGDSLVSGETLQGLGTDGSIQSILNALFGSLLRVAYPPSYSAGPPDSQPPSVEDIAEAVEGKMEKLPRRRDGMEDSADKARRITSKSATDEQQGAVEEKLIPKTESDRDGNPEEDDEEEEQALKGSSTAKAKKKFKLTNFVPDPGYFLAGAIAGGVSRTATAPLDRLKVYLLVNTTKSSETALAAIKKGHPITALQNAGRPFKLAVQELFRTGGIRGFFAGNGLNVVKIMPETAIKFGSYEAAKRTLANLEGHGDPLQINPYSKFTAGGLAGMIAQFFVYPLDTLKFRLQCETVEGGVQGRALVRQTAIKMYADGGLRACYRGVTMGLIGMFPYSAIDMGTFELLKKSYRTYYSSYWGCHEDDANPGNVATGIIGATSGAFGATVVYPLNVVRTRLQTQGTVMHPPTYTGIWDVTQKTIQKEGYRGLYKGLTPNLLKVAPALSITWVVYENSKKILALH